MSSLSCILAEFSNVPASYNLNTLPRNIASPMGAPLSAGKSRHLNFQGTSKKSHGGPQTEMRTWVRGGESFESPCCCAPPLGSLVALMALNQGTRSRAGLHSWPVNSLQSGLPNFPGRSRPSWIAELIAHTYIRHGAVRDGDVMDSLLDGDVTHYFFLYVGV